MLVTVLYAVIPDKPQLKDIQQDVFECFMGGFDALGKLFNLNRKLDNRIASLAFKKAADQRVREIGAFPASFRMEGYDYDRSNGVVRYGFTQCPNAEFAKRHHMEDMLPVMCNCDHLNPQSMGFKLFLPPAPREHGHVVSGAAEHMGQIASDDARTVNQYLHFLTPS